MIISLDLCVCPPHHQFLGKGQLPIEALDRLFCFLFGFKVHKAVTPRLPLQSTGLVKEKIKLLHFAKLLKEFEEVVLGDLGVEVSDPEAVPVLQGALAQDGRVLQRQRLAARLHGGAGRTGTGRPSKLSFE